MKIKHNRRVEARSYEGGDADIVEGELYPSRVFIGGCLEIRYLKDLDYVEELDPL